MSRRVTKYLRVALPFLGSAILLYSCERTAAPDPAVEELRMTEYFEDLSTVNSQNGRRSYHFETPLMEGYSQAREPYREFRKGVKITTYKDDSLSTVDAVLTANYAIYYEKRQLWEAKGDVVVEKSDGKTLYTQQLFWNARTKKIYSNVDSKIVQKGGTDVFIGEGFESDEEFRDWRFRRMKGRMEVDVAPAGDSDPAGASRPGASSDSASASRPTAAAGPAGGSSPRRAASMAAPGAPSRTVEPRPETKLRPASRRSDIGNPDGAPEQAALRLETVDDPGKRELR